MSTLGTILQVRWPIMACADGLYFSIRMNRGNDQTFDPAATDVLEFVETYPGIIIPELLSFAKKYATAEGRSSVDAITLDFVDKTKYTGTINGAPVEEEFGNVPTTVLSEWFNDFVNLYQVWVVQHNADGSVIDAPFSGTYNAKKKPQNHIAIRQGGTSQEKIPVRSRSIQVASLTEDLQKKTWGDLSFTSGDCTRGQFYPGYTWWTNPGRTPEGTGTNTPSYFGKPVVLGPYRDLRGPLGQEGFTIEDTGGTYNTLKPHGVHPIPASYGFPAGLWGISIKHIYEKICAELNLTFGGMQSSLDWYYQKFGSGTPLFPRPLNDTPLSLDNLYVNYNVLNGYHMFGGERWDTPISFKPTQQLGDVLQKLNDLLLVRMEISGSTLNLIPYGVTGDSIPTNWTLISSSEVDPYSGPISVIVNNTGDSLQIQAPLGRIGDSVKREIPFRVRRLSKFLDNSAVNGFSQVFDSKATEECMTYDASYTLEEQASRCLSASYISNGVEIRNEEAWKCLAGLFWHFEATGAEDSPMFAPSTSGDWPDWPFYETDFTWTGFHPVSACVLKDEVPASSEQEVRFCTTLNYHAVILQSVLCRAQNSTVIQRTFSGIADDSGNLSGVHVGFSASWQADGALKTFQSFELNQKLFPGISEVHFIEYDGDSIPQLDTVPYGPADGTDGTKTNSVTEGGSTTTGGNDTSASAPAILRFPSDEQAITPQTDIVGLTHQGISGQTSFFEQWKLFAGTIVGKITAAGKAFFKGFDAMGELGTNFADPVSAQDAMTLAYFTAHVPSLASALITSPATANRNRSLPTANGVDALELQAKTGSTMKLLSLYDAAGSLVGYFNPDGGLNLQGNGSIQVNYPNGPVFVGYSSLSYPDTIFYIHTSGGNGHLQVDADGTVIMTNAATHAVVQYGTKIAGAFSLNNRTIANTTATVDGTDSIVFLQSNSANCYAQLPAHQTNGGLLLFFEKVSTQNVVGVKDSTGAIIKTWAAFKETHSVYDTGASWQFDIV